jgi:hypothetical protein
MKDPLQPGQSPYEVLDVAEGATLAEVDAAFKAGLVKRVNVQKLTTAKRTLQDPLERALVDLFQYYAAALARLEPGSASLPAALLPPARWRTASSWETQMSSRFPDLAAAHSLAVLWYWSAAHIEQGRGENGTPSVRHAWERAIAGWAMVAASDEFWSAVPAEARAEARRQVQERLRHSLHDLEQAHRDRRGSEGSVYQDLELALDTEFTTARHLAAADFKVLGRRLACGPLMLKQQGAVEAVRVYVAGLLASRPGDAVLRALDAALSPFAPIRALIQGPTPEAALDALDALPAEQRDGVEARGLRGAAWHRIGRHQASVDQPFPALDSWRYALQCGNAAIDAEIRNDVVDLCQARSTAQGGQRREAIKVLERGLELVKSERLQATLAELLTQQAIEVFNQPPERDSTPEGLADLRQAQAELERAATLGSSRAAEQVPAGRRLLARLNYKPRQIRNVAFGALPPAARQRFVESALGKGDVKPLIVPGKGGAIAGRVVGTVLALVALYATAAAGFGTLSPELWHGPGVLIVYVFWAAWAALGVLSAVRVRALRRGLPYVPGTYLFPRDLIEANQKGDLVVFPLRALTDFKCVHHHRNGVYQRSDFNFQFDREARTLTVTPQHRAQTVLQEISRHEAEESAALKEGNVDEVARLDPLAEAAPAATADRPRTGPRVVPPPSWLRWRWAIAAGLALVLAPPIWAARNVASDLSAWGEAQRRRTEAAFGAYVQYGWWHAKEAAGRAAQAAFDEAKKKGTVTALRRVRVVYPQHPVAAQALPEIHAVFLKSLARFRAQAAAGDPRIVPFVERLLGHLERSEGAAVLVRFRSPKESALAAADAQVRRRAAGSGRESVPMAPYFTEATASPRERLIVSRLGLAFAEVFPADVLTLSPGPRLTEAAPPAAQPDVIIEYEVRPSGSLYERTDRNAPAFLARTGPIYTGIQVAFAVQMRVPDGGAPFDFQMTLAPPPHFEVAGLGDASAVYATMAERAFDEFSVKLREVFFGKAVKPA